MAIKDGKLIGIPLEKTRVTCEVAQKINHEIVWERKHPEDYFLEAAVITHTLMCHTRIPRRINFATIFTLEA